MSLDCAAVSNIVAAKECHQVYGDSIASEPGHMSKILRRADHDITHHYEL